MKISKTECGNDFQGDKMHPVIQCFVGVFAVGAGIIIAIFGAGLFLDAVGLIKW